MHLILLAAAIVSIAPVQKSEANRQPQAASAPGLTALVFGSQNSIYLSTSYDNGRSFSKATEVASGPALMLGRHRGPRVVISGGTIVVSAIGDAKAGDLLSWRSNDSGRTWSKPVVINDVPGSAREGLHAMTADAHGELAAVWLDVRGKVKRLYGAYSRDRGASWSKNVLLYESPSGTICQCCDPSIASSAPDTFAVMFRNVLDGNRDMYTATWHIHGGVSPAQKLGNGSWAIDACPMDGGGIAHFGNKTITAWRRDRTVYLDQVGQPETPLGNGKDVAMTMSRKGAYVAWVAPSGIELHEPDQNNVTCLSSTGAFPNLTRLSNGSILAAWENNGSIEAEVLE